MTTTRPRRLPEVAAACLVASLLATAGGQAAVASALAPGPVPAGFEPASADFVSSDVGFVLGTAPCAHGPCTALVATYDSGQSWAGLPAPKVPLQELEPASPSAVGQVTFASPADGWAWGPGLWYTADGGETWGRPSLAVPAPGAAADVLSLQAAGGYAYALVTSWAGRYGPASVLLERSPLGSGQWSPLSSMSGRLGPMAWYGSAGWVVKAPAHPGQGPEQIWRTADAGATWARLPDPCYQPAQGIDVAGLAAVSASHLFELCAGNPGAGSEAKELLASADGGATAHLVGKLPLGGLVAGVAAQGSQDVLVAASSGAGFLYSSTDGGRSWRTSMLDDGGAGLSDLSYPAYDLAVVVDGRPGEQEAFPDRVLVTNSGGYSWGPLSIGPRRAVLAGPGAVWAKAPRYQVTDAQACGLLSPRHQPPGAQAACVGKLMRAQGASAAAVAYFDATWSYLIGYVPAGRLAVGYTLSATPMDCGCFGYVLLGGQYPGTSPPGPALASPVYAGLLKAYPGLMAGPGRPPFVESARPGPGGGEELVFQFPLDNVCDACSTPYRARVAELFSAYGAYLGSTTQGPCLGQLATGGAAAVGAATGDGAARATVPEPACPRPLAGPPL